MGRQAGIVQVLLSNTSPHVGDLRNHRTAHLCMWRHLGRPDLGHTLCLHYHLKGVWERQVDQRGRQAGQGHLDCSDGCHRSPAGKVLRSKALGCEAGSQTLRIRSTSFSSVRSV